MTCPYCACPVGEDAIYFPLYGNQTLHLTCAVEIAMGLLSKVNQQRIERDLEICFQPYQDE